MKKIMLVSAVAAAAGFAALPASAADILARVISSTPVVQQVAVPRQVCTNEAVVSQAPKSGAGALVGAVAGGAAGNAIGNGGGRALPPLLASWAAPSLATVSKAPTARCKTSSSAPPRPFMKTAPATTTWSTNTRARSTTPRWQPTR